MRKTIERKTGRVSRVEIHLRETAQPIIHLSQNTYTKGPMFCVLQAGRVFKYPVRHIFRVVEDYAPRG